MGLLRSGLERDVEVKGSTTGRIDDEVDRGGCGWCW